MEPVTPPNPAPSPEAVPAERFAPAPSPPEPATLPRLTPWQVLRTHWLAASAGLVLLIGLGLYLWLRSAAQDAERSREVVAAASENIEPEIKAAPAGAPGAAVSPTAQLDLQRRQDQEAQNAPQAPSPDEVAEVFAVDTTGQGARRQQRQAALARRRADAQAAAADVDTLETTVQDAETGAYRAQTLLVPRRRTLAASGSSGARHAGSARAGRGGGLLPLADTDGVPFETDPNVLSMLANSPAETRAAYERMTGHRYRDPAQAARTLAERAAGAAGAADGFNTVKVGNSSRLLAQSQQQRAQQLTPDVFFQCVINGEQKVRTGSVVLLRLSEDAVVSGVTFPKNLVFAGVASVGANNVDLVVSRLGPTRVAAAIYDFNYLPGIMIDPVKRVARDLNQAGTDVQQQSTREVSTAIDRSASAANSVVGVGGRIATTILARPATRTRLRDVLLPDGYPILITTAGAGQATAAGGR